MKTVDQYNDELAKIDKSQRDICELAKAEKERDLTSDEEVQFDKYQDDFTSITAKRDRAQAFEQRETLDKGVELKKDPVKTSEDEKESRKEAHSKAFRKMLLGGEVSLSSEERETLYRAQSKSPTSAGGFLVPEGFSNEIDIALLQFGGMLNVARVLKTSTGNDIPWPTVDDTANSGRLLAENADASSGTTDIAFGSKTLQAFKYTSDLLKVSSELLQDEEIGIEALMGSLLGERLGRIGNTHWTTGTGSSQPNGVVTASALGDTAAGATAVTRDDIVNLIHSVDPAYRGNARLMFNDSTLSEIKKLAFGSADDRPLYQGGDARSGAPATIEGFEFTINQDMASIASAAKSMLFGDFNKYIIRMARDIFVKRADERYIELDQIAFVGFMRMDGELINTAAVKHLIQAV